MKQAWPYALLLVAGVLLAVALSGPRGTSPAPSAETPKIAPAPAPALAAAAPSGARTIDPHKRFSVIVPSGWSVDWKEPSEGATEVLQAHLPGAGQDVVVRAFASRIPFVSALELFTKAVQLATSRDEKVVDGGRSEQDGRVTAVVESVSSDGTRRTRAVFVLERGLLVQVRSSAPSERFNEFRAAFAVLGESVQPGGE